MVKSVRYFSLALFLVLLTTTGFLIYQYSRAIGSSLVVDSIPKNIANNLGPFNSIKKVFSQKVVLTNATKKYKVMISNQSEVEKLAETLLVFNNPDKKIDKIEITILDNLQNGTEHSLDDKVWAKIDSKVENNIFSIFLMLNLEIIKSFPNDNWNKQVSGIILTEFYDKSPIAANTPVSNRLNVVNKLVLEKEKADKNKYYFEVAF